MSKRILITGASSGIGKALAEKFCMEGWQVLGAARRYSLLKKIAANKQLNKNFIPIKLDITKKKEVKDRISFIIKKYGFPDIIVLNAGTNNPNNKKILNLAEVDYIYKINFFGTLNCIDIILKEKKDKLKVSELVLVSSVAGYRGLPYASAYCSSKAAITNFAESIYHQCKSSGINVRVINPGFIKTPLTDKNNFAMPMIISSENAAKLIYKKLLYTSSFEINLPALFCFFMKILRILPYSIYFKVTGHILKKL